MNKYLRNTHLDLDSHTGWEQMQLLLDKNLPIKSKYTKKRFCYQSVITTTFLVLLLMSGLVLNNEESIKAPDKSFFTGRIFSDRTYDKHFVIDADVEPGKNEKVFLRLKKKNLQTNHCVLDNQSKNSTSLSEKISWSTLVDSSTTNLNIDFSKQQQEVVLVNQPPIAEPPIRELVIDSASMGSTTKPFKNDLNSEHPGDWSLSAGIAINATNSKAQSFRPYPVVLLRYNFSKRFFLASALSVGSSLSSESQGVEKKVYLNDTINNVLFYNKVKHYYDVVFTDISVNAGVNIGRNISIQAGVQAAVLLKAKSKALLEPYDFQFRMAGPASDQLFPGATALPINITDYKVDIRKLDYRLTSGINYNIKKFGFGLSYQHSFRPMIKGDLTSGNRNRLVTLNVLYKIK
jgi:hypothetical protein